MMAAKTPGRDPATPLLGGNHIGDCLQSCPCVCCRADHALATLHRLLWDYCVAETCTYPALVGSRFSAAFTTPTQLRHRRPDVRESRHSGMAAFMGISGAFWGGYAGAIIWGAKAIAPSIKGLTLLGARGLKKPNALHIYFPMKEFISDDNVILTCNSLNL